MKVLVACEFSGTVRDAFAAHGHDAWSCDLLETERPGRHIVGDARAVLDHGWDLIIAHPPCTALAVSGARWFAGRLDEQDQALGFFLRFLAAKCPRIAVENPISVVSRFVRKPDQIVHPWQFWKGEEGAGESKATCLWLKGLPRLVPTTPNETGRVARVHFESPGPDRWKNRSRTHQGLADAMAEQWSSIAHPHASRDRYRRKRAEAAAQVTP